MRVKCIETDECGADDTTVGKVYDIISEANGCYIIVDDEGDICHYSKSKFKILK